MLKTWLKTTLVTAAIGVVCANAAASLIDDAKIMIDRALNSPSVSVKYSGASATLIELRLNGISVGTMERPAGSTSGSVNFTVDLATLHDGDNDVEVRLYDKSGKVVGVEKSTISSDQSAKGPVYVMSPKVGAEVIGSVDIKVGFGQEFTNKYVSFFVDNQFRAMTNIAPFAYTWDSTREQNGWHEVEVWVVDRDGNTYKTRKVKVFVNNPGGRTVRPAVTPTPTTPVVPKVVPTVKPNIAAVKSAATPIATSSLPYTMVSTLNAVVTGSAALKAHEGESTAMGARTMTPGTAKAPAVKTAVTNSGKTGRHVIEINTAAPTVTGAAPVKIEKGVRLPNFGTYSIVYGGKPVALDVAPRVQDGIPLTPFRGIFEAGGGEVKWDAASKSVTALKDGDSVFIKIGDKLAKVNKLDVDLEIAAFIERGRTIVPLSFITESMNVEIEYDPATGHVLIKKKN